MKGLLFTYGLTYGGAVISLFNPFVGLLVYITFAIIRPDSLWFWSVEPGNYSRIIGIALLLGWAIKGFGTWDTGRARGIVGCLLAYFAWACFCAIFAANQTVAWSFVENAAKILLPFLVGITTIRTVAQLKCLAWVIALSQGYVAYDLNMAYWDGFNRVQEIGFGGMDNNCVAIAMVCGTGLAFFLGVGESCLWRKLLAFGAAALMTHVVMFSMSRGGMLGLLVMGVIGFVLMPKRRQDYVWFAVAVIIGIRLAGPAVVERFASSFTQAEERDTSAQSRVVMWGVCIDAMAANPLIGLGPDHWPLYAADFGLEANKEAHTLWLQIGAELGLPGLGFLLGFYILSLRQLHQIIRRPLVDPWIVASARMVIASLCGFMVSAQFVSLEGLELPYYVNLLGAGGLMLTSHSSNERSEELAAVYDDFSEPVLV